MDAIPASSVKEEAGRDVMGCTADGMIVRVDGQRTAGYTAVGDGHEQQGTVRKGDTRAADRSGRYMYLNRGIERKLPWQERQ